MKRKYLDTAKRWRLRERRRVCGGYWMSKDEAEWFLARKRDLGMSWLEIAYRGIGENRTDVLNRLNQAKKDSV